MRALPFTVVLAACQTQAPTSAEVRATEVVLHDAEDAPRLTLTRTATGCRAEPGALVITSTGAATAAGAWQLGPGPTGRELRGPAGLVARIADEPGPPRRLSLIDPVGVPMVRLAIAADGVTASDAGRAPVGRIAVTADGAALTAGDARRERVTGTTDLELAARLLAPAELPLEARALFACERLAAVTPAVK